MKKNSRSAFLAVAAAACCVLGAGTVVAASADGAPPLVYTCQGVQDGQDPACAHAQEFEVFDRNGAPVYSVGEYGGDQVYGDNRNLYPPGSVYNPAVVESYTTPAGYGKTSCVSPEIWIEPGGIWACERGKFAKVISLGGK